MIADKCKSVTAIKPDPFISYFLMYNVATFKRIIFRKVKMWTFVEAIFVRSSTIPIQTSTVFVDTINGSSCDLFSKQKPLPPPKTTPSYGSLIGSVTPLTTANDHPNRHDNHYHLTYPASIPFGRATRSSH